MMNRQQIIYFFFLGEKKSKGRELLAIPITDKDIKFDDQVMDSHQIKRKSRIGEQKRMGRKGDKEFEFSFTQPRMGCNR